MWGRETTGNWSNDSAVVSGIPRNNSTITVWFDSKEFDYCGFHSDVWIYFIVHATVESSMGRWAVTFRKISVVTFALYYCGYPLSRDGKRFCWTSELMFLKSLGINSLMVMIIVHNILSHYIQICTNALCLA